MSLSKNSINWNKFGSDQRCRVLLKCEWTSNISFDHKTSATAVKCHVLRCVLGCLAAHEIDVPEGKLTLASIAVTWLAALSGFVLIIDVQLRPVMDEISIITLTNSESVRYRLHALDYIGPAQQSARSVSTTLWAHVFVPGIATEYDHEIGTAVGETVKEADLVATEVKPLIDESGLGTLRTYHVGLKVASEQRGVNPAILHRARVITLPSGSQATLKFSSEFCATYKIHRACCRLLPCDCSSHTGQGNSSRKRKASNFMRQLENNNNTD